jgi:uncharacterized membrane protein (DUF4010 family)
LRFGIGLLIGLERGWRTREAESGSRTAGIRTLAISGLLGGTTGAIVEAAGGAAIVGAALVLAAGFATYAGVIAVFTREGNRAVGTFSATTAIAGMLTYLLGAYAVIGDVRVAAGVAVAAAALLALREGLHDWVEQITWPELRSGLTLLAMTFIALPLLPNAPIGPFGGFNPREVWIIAIVLACVSFVGYAAVKYFGARRGVLLAAAAGGLVSSTAVTVTMPGTNARRAAAGEGSPTLLAAGVAVAAAVSFLRILAIAAVLQPRLLALIGPALLAAAACATGFAIALVLKRTEGEEQKQRIELRNPFKFWSVIGLTIILATIIVLGRAVEETFGASGAIVGAIAVGVADVDSVAVSIARLTPVPLSPENGSYAILAAAGSNTLAKSGISAVIGRGRFAVTIGAPVMACFLAAAVALALTFTFVRG